MASTLTNTDLHDLPTARAAAERDPRDELEQRFRSGVSWFYWVALLSLADSAAALFNGEWGFHFGLGVTRLIEDSAFRVAVGLPDPATVGKAVGLGAGLAIVGGVAFMGWLAHERMQWVFVVGLALYLGDALLCLLAGDFLSLAFHGWVLFAITSGLLACRKLAALGAPPGEEVFDPA